MRCNACALCVTARHDGILRFASTSRIFCSFSLTSSVTQSTYMTVKMSGKTVSAAYCASEICEQTSRPVTTNAQPGCNHRRDKFQPTCLDKLQPASRQVTTSSARVYGERRQGVRRVLRGRDLCEGASRRVRAYASLYDGFPLTV